MDETQQEFDALMRRLRDGCPAAVRELLARYEADVLHVVRRQLHRKLRTQYDSVDFVQGVWASFFALGPDDFPRFDNPKALKAYLVKMARHKVFDAFRQRFGTQKRNPNRARSLDGSVAAEAQAVASPQPTPSHVVMAREEWARLLQRYPDRKQQILLLLHQDKTNQEIAAELGMNERTVRRLVSTIRQDQLRQRAEPAPLPVLDPLPPRPPEPSP
jgi:RNA polymerase sigma factor (sigma-70 family)